MKELVMTRCLVCMTTGHPGFIAIEDSYPVVMVNYMYDPHVLRFVTSHDKLWVCKEHFDKISPERGKIVRKN